MNPLSEAIKSTARLQNHIAELVAYPTDDNDEDIELACRSITDFLGAVIKLNKAHKLDTYLKYLKSCLEIEFYINIQIKKEYTNEYTKQ